MIRVKHLFSLLLMAACLCLVTSEAQAHNAFKKFLASKYPDKKVNCNACHVDKQKKEVRNSFGQMYSKLMGIEDLSATYKEKKGGEKKQYEEEVMVPAFEKAYEKLSKMTYDDMVKAGLLDGVEADEK